MRRAHQIIRIIIFIALFCLCFLWISRVFKAKDSEELSPYYYDYSQDTFDVIIAGSSVSKNGIQPVRLYENNGIAAYNLSNGNQSLACSYYILQDAIERDHPDLIILDMTYAENSGIVRSNAFIHYLTDEMPVTDSYRLQMIQDLVPEDDRMEFYWPFYSYHTRWKELKTSDFETGTYQKYTMGSVTSARTMSLSAPLFNKIDQEDELSDTSREYTEKIISLCQNTGTPLLLICCPVAGDGGGDVSENVYNDRRSIMKQIGTIAEENGITFLNFLEDDSALGLDPYNDYRDGVHLNRWGSAKLTDWLGNYITQNYEISDRRGDSDFSSAMEKLLPHYESVLREQSFSTTSRAATIFKVLSDYAKDEDLLYLICGQDFKGNSDNLASSIASGLASLGVSYDQNYSGLTNLFAVIDSGNVVDSGQRVVADDIDYSRRISGTWIQIRTNAMTDDPDLHYNNIIVNGGNYAPAQSGLCIAVVNKNNHKVLDCVTISYDGNAVTHFTEAGN